METRTDSFIAIRGRLSKDSKVAPHCFKDHILPRMNRPALSAFLFRCVLAVGLALALPARAADRLEVSTRDELLLFWDEKDLYVQSSTRHAKPISQTAENMTVVTAREIEAMNAHTVDEVLDRITGLFLLNNSREFGSTALVAIQGSEPRHVLILVDGVSWNTLSDGHALANAIPVGIIDRIEIIRGPASSAWGSALGGVINIITKAVGSTARPTGAIRASYGQAASQDYRAEAAGLAGPAGYYLQAGHLASDGLQDDRHSTRTSLFAKTSLPVAGDTVLGLSAVYSDPAMRAAVYRVAAQQEQIAAIHNFSAAATLATGLTSNLGFDFQIYTFGNQFDSSITLLGSSLGADGEMFRQVGSDEKNVGARTKLVWTQASHTLVVGLDGNHGRQDCASSFGAYYQSLGRPATFAESGELNTWAVFVNDTVRFGALSLTPGLRYDHANTSEPFTSPSLGATYALADQTILRAAVARGFTLPSLALTTTGGWRTDPNPNLRPEKVKSYQAGVETGIMNFLRLKGTAFRHDMADEFTKFTYQVGAIPFRTWVNGGEVSRRGLEFEVETAPIYRISVRAGIAYVHKKTSRPAATYENYAGNLGITYDDRDSFLARLDGHYARWAGDYADPSASANDPTHHGTMIWDLNLRKRIPALPMTGLEAYVTVHNLFNETQYTIEDLANPERWAEAGLKLMF